MVSVSDAERRERAISTQVVTRVWRYSARQTVSLTAWLPPNDCEAAAAAVAAAEPNSQAKIKSPDSTEMQESTCVRMPQHHQDDDLLHWRHNRYLWNCSVSQLYRITTGFADVNIRHLRYNAINYHFMISHNQYLQQVHNKTTSQRESKNALRANY